VLSVPTVADVGPAAVTSAPVDPMPSVRSVPTLNAVPQLPEPMMTHAVGLVVRFSPGEVAPAVVRVPMVTLVGPWAVISAPGLLSPVVYTWFATAVMLHPPVKVMHTAGLVATSIAGAPTPAVESSVVELNVTLPVERNSAAVEPSPVVVTLLTVRPSGPLVEVTLAPRDKIPDVLIVLSVAATVPPIRRAPSLLAPVVTNVPVSVTVSTPGVVSESAG